MLEVMIAFAAQPDNHPGYRYPAKQQASLPLRCVSGLGEREAAHVEQNHRAVSGGPATVTVQKGQDAHVFPCKWGR